MAETQMSHTPRIVIAPAPHIQAPDTTRSIMVTVCLALVPALVAALLFFGIDVLRLVLLSCGGALAAEALAQRLRRQPITVSDGSALVTGLLLGLSLPPTLPGWMAVLGAAVAIILGKQLFGGLGFNPFNPALIGRAFLTSSFATAMTTWTAPFDTVTAATPLQIGEQAYSQLFFGTVAGSIGETSALALLLGGVFLFYRGVLDYRLPVGFFATIAVLALLAGESAFFHLFSGSALFVGLFMITDTVTNPVTPKGRWIFGVGAGIILMIIRLWGSLPEGVTFAILLMNAATPLINRATRPRIFGKGVGSIAGIH